MGYKGYVYRCTFIYLRIITLTIGFLLFSVHTLYANFSDIPERLANVEIVLQIDFSTTASHWDINKIKDFYPNATLQNGYVFFEKDLTEYNRQSDQNHNFGKIPAGIDLQFAFGENQQVFIGTTASPLSAYLAIATMNSSAELWGCPGFLKEPEDWQTVFNNGYKPKIVPELKFTTLYSIIFYEYKNLSKNGIITNPLSNTDLISKPDVRFGNFTGKNIVCLYAEIRTVWETGRGGWKDYLKEIVDAWWPKGSADDTGTGEWQFNFNVHNRGIDWYSELYTYGDVGTVQTIYWDDKVKLTHSGYGGKLQREFLSAEPPTTIKLKLTGIWSGSENYVSLIFPGDDITFSNIIETPQAGDPPQPQMLRLSIGWTSEIVPPEIPGAGNITITSPNGGEIWAAGSTQNISWTASGVANVKLEYSTNNGAVWTTIVATTTVEAGSYAWVIPPTLNSTTCKVKVTDTANASVSDVSDTVFTIALATEGLAESAWPMFRQNPQHTGRGIATVAASSTVKWKFQTGNFISSSPAIGSDGTVYVGSEDKYIYAVKSDGILKWKFQTGSMIGLSSPAIGSDGTVYIGSTDNYLYAVKSDGTLKWKFLTGRDVSSSPAIGSDGTVYIGSTDNYLYAVKSDGTLKWKFQTGYMISQPSPAIDSDGTVYVGSGDYCIYAIRSDGTLKWKFKTGYSIHSSPAIGSDGTVYVGSLDNYFYAVKSDGTLKWKFQTGNAIESSPAIDSDGTVYVGSNDGYLYAVTSDGILKWKFQTGSMVPSSPAIDSDGTVYVGSLDTYLYAVKSDGTLKWKFQTGDGISSSPAIGSDGTVYVGSHDHYLYAFVPETLSAGNIIVPFSFAHITDVHIGAEWWEEEMSPPYAGSTSPVVIKKSAYSNFIDTLKEINKLNPKPDFILIGGDNVDWANVANFDNFKRALEGIDELPPVYIIPGNHDRYEYPVVIQQAAELAWGGNDFLEQYHDSMKSPIKKSPDEKRSVSILEYFEPYLSSTSSLPQGGNRYNYKFEYNVYLFIGLDSGEDYRETYFHLPNDPRFCPEGSGLDDLHIEALNNLSEKYKDIPKIIFMHHPIYTGLKDDGHEDGSIVKNRTKFINYCKNNNVKIVLSGHTHESHIHDRDGTEASEWPMRYDSPGAMDWDGEPLFIQTPSATMDKDKFRHGYRIIDVISEVVNVHSYTPTTPLDKKEVYFIGPAELHIYDSQGRHTGSGSIVTDIPDSYYTGYHGPSTPQLIILYNTDEDYKFRVVGIDEGTYELYITSIENRETTTFTATEIPTSANVIHEYIINWTDLSQGEEGVTLQIDSDGDGTPEHTVASNETFTQADVTPPTGGSLKNENVYAYPNPFNPDRESTNIRFSLSKSGKVTIKLYDVSNRLVTTLNEGESMEANKEQSVSWNGKNDNGSIVANGVYFYVIESSAGERAVGKIAVMR